MSKSPPPFEGVSLTLERIDRLRRTIRDHREREKKLEGSFLLQKHRLDEALEERGGREEARINQAIQARALVFEERMESLMRHHERRMETIDLAHRRTKKSFTETLGQKQGSQTYIRQKAKIDADRDHAEAMAPVQARRAEQEAPLSRARSHVATLEAAASNGLSAYPGLGTRVREMTSSGTSTGTDSAGSLDEQVETLKAQVLATDEEIASLRSLPIPAFFRILPPVFFGLLALIIPAAVALLLRSPSFGFLQAGIAGAVAMVAGFVLYLFGKGGAERQASSAGAKLAETKASLAAAEAMAEQEHKDLVRAAEANREARIAEAEDLAQRAGVEAVHLSESRPQQIEEQATRLRDLQETRFRVQMDELKAGREAAMDELRGEASGTEQNLLSERETGVLGAQEQRTTGWAALEKSWNDTHREDYEALASVAPASRDSFPSWDTGNWEQWSPPTQFDHAVPFAELKLDFAKLADGLPEDERLALPGSSDLEVPLHLCFPDEGSLLFETEDAGRTEAIDLFNSLILRLLAEVPPGKLAFTIFDPVALGENFAGVMNLADYEESLITSKIWTQTNHIEQRLGDLAEHMEKVIQMYLRTDYQTIVEYNEKAGSIAEKYHFLVVADFPSGFSETAAKRLLSIATNGPKCGVYLLLHWDTRLALPQDFTPDDLRTACTRIVRKQDRFALADKRALGTTLELAPAPPASFAAEFVHRAGAASVDSTRVEVPFSQVSPAAGEEWTRSTTAELCVPIGRTGATKLQELAIGKGTNQHTLVAGKTGSGKSTLFHVMVTNLALWSSPDEVEFYLVDFKKGVEFKSYATQKLPHARVIAIESDREFGLSVLQRLDEELRRRGDLFRKLGVQDLAAFRGHTDGGVMPRTLLLIDEFQEFFTEEDRVAQSAAVLLDRIVRQGRAFGIHVILGSQTLGGAFTLARTTLGQMGIRIALQCNESDAFLIMDDDNPAPKLLTRPGEGIYNDMAGRLEGNSPFQVVWLPDEERDAALARAAELRTTMKNPPPEPIVFEGNVPAGIRDNPELRELLAQGPAKDASKTSATIWLGAPNSIKGPTRAQFTRQSGNHLLMAGQREEAALAMCGAGVIALAAQFPKDKDARIIVLDSSAPDSAEQIFLDRVAASAGREVEIVRGGELPALLSGLAKEKNRRTEGEGEAGATAPPVYLFVLGLQRFKKLRHEEDFGFSLDDDDDDDHGGNPGTQFDEIILEGAGVGLHVIATCDSYNNLNRTLSRKAIGEFEMRIVFQMSANDSASLIESSKATTLGLNRALFYNEQEGYLETFRPYALPDDTWLDSVIGR